MYEFYKTYPIENKESNSINNKVANVYKLQVTKLTFFNDINNLLNSIWKRKLIFVKSPQKLNINIA